MLGAFFVTPLDVMKTRLQAVQVGQKANFDGYFDCVR